MDGTLIDNMMLHHRAWQKQLSILGLELSIEEVMEQVHGINTEILKRFFGDRFTHEERLAIADEKEARYREICNSDLKLVRGLGRLLDELKAANIPMAVGTAAPPDNTNLVMDILKLRPYFQAIVHSDDVERGKPDPEVFEKAAVGMQLPVQDCLVFEDSIVGAKTAANAGCTMIAVTTTHQQPEFAAFSHIHSFIDHYEGITLDYLRAEFGL